MTDRVVGVVAGGDWLAEFEMKDGFQRLRVAAWAMIEETEGGWLHLEPFVVDGDHAHAAYHVDGSLLRLRHEHDVDRSDGKVALV